VWREAVSLVRLLGIWRRRRGKIPPPVFSLVERRRWGLGRGEGEKGRGQGDSLLGVGGVVGVFPLMMQKKIEGPALPINPWGAGT